jgi:hypothetical protein
MGLSKTSDVARSTTKKRGKKTPAAHHQSTNHITKSLVPHREPVEKHSNLKGVSSQSHRICVPMFNAASEGTLAHSRVEHWHKNFMDR